MPGFQEGVLALFEVLHCLLGDAEAFELEVSVGGLHGVVEQHDRVGAEVGLVGELVLEEGGGGVGTEVHGLIPSDAVVVDVDFAEHLHHFELVFVAVEVGDFLVDGGFDGCFDNVGFGVVAGFGEGEGVCYFENSIFDAESEEGAGYEFGKGFLAVLDDL